MTNETTTLPYKSYNQLMQSIFGCKVYKVSIDGGFSCPNRDGSKGYGGCIFCDNEGSSSRTNKNSATITEQIQNNIKVRKSRYGAKKFIAYFQSFSNTYAPLSELKKKYDEALDADRDIVGINISTRPDCIDEEKIQLIASYKDRLKYVCLEYGMQTCHDKTLKLINRKETHQDFINALELTKKYGLHYCAHIILGLPGESYEDQFITANQITELRLEGIKLHFLVAMENTSLSKMYKQGLWNPFSYESYLSLAVSFLERVHKECTIHRISLSGHPKHIVAPLWMKNKTYNVSEDLRKEFQKRKTYQGYFCPAAQN